MNKPVVADNKPVQVSLEADREYHFCTCGRSANQPFCDGSHQGTGLEPVAFTAEKTAYLCGCKRTANRPFCDGSHHDGHQHAGKTRNGPRQSTI